MNHLLRQTGFELGEARRKLVSVILFFLGGFSTAKGLNRREAEGRTISLLPRYFIHLGNGAAFTRGFFCKKTAIADSADIETGGEEEDRYQ
ncbi:MAG: hypothetical protein SF052_03445 [Bacteroidia bacterium]|nr:hypothetical protein [Bacteroidia bacterium]